MSDFAVEFRDVVKTFQTPEGGHVNAVDHVDFQIRHGEFFSMLGSSGCGKTTSLRMMAGFEWPSSGDVLIDGESQGRKPPFQRPVNTVFQSYALFQHMTVSQNIAFGLEMKQVPQAEIKRRVEEALEMVKLGGMAKRYPKQLSGGQQQRIALARALVNRPKVLLLDEPLGALDLKLRKEMQIELKMLQQEVGITFIFVTHDQEEAMTMSDRIAVMSHGKALQVGTPLEIYERPNCRFVADFIGESNFLKGTVSKLEREQAVVSVPGVGNVAGVVGAPVQVGSPALVSVRPEKIQLLRSEEAGSHIFPAMVEHVTYVGADTRVEVRLGEARVRVYEQNRVSSLDPQAHHEKDKQVWVSIQPENILVLPVD